MTRERANQVERERENKGFSKSCHEKSRGYYRITTGRINFRNTNQIFEYKDI